jgi:tetrapyrrole methylase family protein/MazG family protein
MGARSRIVVVGLGPGDVDLLTIGTRDAIDRIAPRFVRTTRHPAVRAVPDAVAFDDVYEAAGDLDSVYPAIVARLLAAASEHGEILYAVPGSPIVAERTVELLLADESCEIEIHAALSFLDLTWARLGVDPVARGVRIVDGHRFAVDAAGERGPLLVAQCDSVEVLSDVKLALDAGIESCLRPDATVTVLQRLGLPDERVAEIPWIELDRVEPDHLTSVYIPDLAAPVSQEIARFVELVAVLRSECPWDRDQTHESLRRHLLEESYEVLEAIDNLDVVNRVGYDHLEEELGDLLFQVLFHSQLAAEEGQFTIADVAANVHDKLRSRHPHVFGDVDARGAHLGDAKDADGVVRNWEQIKKAEKGRASVFDGVPDAIPALLYALKVQKKAASLDDMYVDPNEMPVPTTVRDALVAFDDSPDEDTVGSLLFAIVDDARRMGVDPETALRAAAVKYRDAARSAELDGPVTD